jgi:L-rhamnose mutarotase
MYEIVSTKPEKKGRDTHAARSDNHERLMQIIPFVGYRLSMTRPHETKETLEVTKRFCLTLDLQDDAKLISEYEYWHMPEHIWPEIPKGIRQVGIVDMEIYRFGSRLFMIMEAPKDFDFDRQMSLLAGLPRQKEWEAFVSKFQKSAPDADSSEKWKMTKRIFKLP